MVDAVSTVEQGTVPDENALDLGYTVSIDAFSGPLDLLLFLVRKSELDIIDIPVATITDQFVALIRDWQARGELDLEGAGDFILMAATLLEIKARTIAPPPLEEGEADAEDPDELLDPRADLIGKLLAYRRFKEAVGFLGRLETERSVRLLRQVREDIPEDPDEAAGIDLGELHVAELSKFWYTLLARIGGGGPRTVMKDDLPIEGSIRALSERAGLEKSLTLHQLFAAERTLQGRVSMLMATLECARQRIVEATQHEQYGDVTLRFRAPEDRVIVATEFPPEEPGKRRRRRPPLVTFQAPIAPAQDELEDAVEPEEKPETDEERFLRELNERCDLDGVLSRVLDVEKGFQQYWETLHPPAVPPPTPVAELPVATQPMVEPAVALAPEARVIEAAAPEPAAQESVVIESAVLIAEIAATAVEALNTVPVETAAPEREQPVLVSDATAAIASVASVSDEQAPPASEPPVVDIIDPGARVEPTAVSEAALAGDQQPAALAEIVIAITPEASVSDEQAPPASEPVAISEAASIVDEVGPTAVVEAQPIGEIPPPHAESAVQGEVEPAARVEVTNLTIASPAVETDASALTIADLPSVEAVKPADSHAPSEESPGSAPIIATAAAVIEAEGGELPPQPDGAEYSAADEQSAGETPPAVDEELPSGLVREVAPIAVIHVAVEAEPEPVEEVAPPETEAVSAPMEESPVATAMSAESAKDEPVAGETAAPEPLSDVVIPAVDAPESVLAIPVPTIPPTVDPAWDDAVVDGCAGAVPDSVPVGEAPASTSAPAVADGTTIAIASIPPAGVVDNAPIVEANALVAAEYPVRPPSVPAPVSEPPAGTLRPRTSVATKPTLPISRTLLLALGLTAGAAGAAWWFLRPEPLELPAIAIAEHPLASEPAAIPPIAAPASQPVPVPVSSPELQRSLSAAFRELVTATPERWVGIAVWPVAVPWYACLPVAAPPASLFAFVDRPLLTGLPVAAFVREGAWAWCATGAWVPQRPALLPLAAYAPRVDPPADLAAWAAEPDLRGRSALIFAQPTGWAALAGG